MLLLGVGGTSTPNDALGFDDLVGWEGLRQVFADAGAAIRNKFVYTADDPVYVPQQSGSDGASMRLTAVAVVARNVVATETHFANVTVTLIRRSGATQRVGEIVLSAGDGNPRAFVINGLSNDGDPFVRVKLNYLQHSGANGVIVDAAVLQVAG